MPRGSKGKLTDTQRAEAAARYAAGESVAVLAREYGVCYRSMHFNLAKRVPMRRRGPQPGQSPNATLTEQEALAALRMLADDVPRKVVAKRFGVGYHTICKLDNGIHYQHLSLGDSHAHPRVAADSLS